MATVAKAQEKPSRVPTHLRQLRCSTVPVSPLQTQAPYSYSLQRTYTSSLKDVELCPIHWRRPLKRSLRKRLKDIVLKETPVHPYERPRIMHMKDSDDYITARAANPWTGQISPSIRSPRSMTCLPLTPESPREALKLCKHRPSSPTPEPRRRPLMQNVTTAGGRKISTGSLQRCKPGWSSTTVCTTAASEQTDTCAGADPAGTILADDRLVLRMPSAREPQPYIYPGRTATEIKALERLKDPGYQAHELMQTSATHHNASQPGGGHDAPRQSGNGERKASGGHPLKPHEQSQSSAQQKHHGLRPALQEARPWPGRAGSECAKSKLGTKTGDSHGAHGAPRTGRTIPVSDEPRPNSRAATFARPAMSVSPSTPAAAKRVDGNDESAIDGTVLQTVREIGVSSLRNASEDDETSLLQKCGKPHAIPRKPVGAVYSAPSRPRGELQVQQEACDMAAQIGDRQEDESNKSDDLSKLPRVRLVHPALASLTQKQQRFGIRQCSLGCERAAVTGLCLQQRSASTPSISAPHPPGHFFEGPDDDGDLPIADVKEMKTLLLLGGQLLAFLTALTVLWKVGTALVMVIEALLWPFVVPFQVMLWLVGVS